METSNIERPRWDVEVKRVPRCGAGELERGSGDLHAYFEADSRPGVDLRHHLVENDFMGIADIATEKLSRPDKIALMERLWVELQADDAESDEIPAWHAAILESRAGEWERRAELGEDLEEVIKSLQGRAR